MSAEDDCRNAYEAWREADQRGDSYEDKAVLVQRFSDAQKAMNEASK